MTVCTGNQNYPTQSSKKSTNQTMKSQKTKKSKRLAFSNLNQINLNAAGIDVASKEHWVCVPPGCTKENVKRFGTFTCDLHAISAWLKSCGVTTVAMESTGLYWVPLFLLLIEDGFDVCLINARHIKNVSGRPKTDRLDCQWIQRLHTYGLLSASFVPDKDLWMFRAVVRHRETLIKLCDRKVQHMQKALQQMNLLLANVISDITGVTGLKIIDAIVSGERSPMTLAKLADCRIKSSTSHIAKSLEGNYQDELLFVLKQAVDGYRFERQQIIQCDQKIESLLYKWHKEIDEKIMRAALASTKARKPKQNEPTYDAEKHFYKILKIDLTALPGFSTSTIQSLFSEVGADMSSWKTEHHFTSWAGLSPSPDISGGKILKNKTKKVQSRVAETLRMAALSCGRTDTALGAFYRRLKARKGAKKALTATARKLAIIFYRMVKYQIEFIELGADYYIRNHAPRVKRQLDRKARLLGYKLVPINQESNGCVSESENEQLLA